MITKYVFLFKYPIIEINSEHFFFLKHIHKINGRSSIDLFTYQKYFCQINK